ncbi:MAG: helix-turn-helix domain-containing protein, partial [Bacteroidota bacterium]
VGLSPKYLSRVIRLQSVLQQLHNRSYRDLTSRAFEEGYYDQAHFIRDFKSMTGHTPKDYYHDDLELSALFYAKQ